MADLVFQLEVFIDGVLEIMEISASGERDARDRAQTFARRQHPRPAMISITSCRQIGAQLPLWQSVGGDGPDAEFHL